MPDRLWFVWGFSHEEREDTYHWKRTEKSEAAVVWGRENESTTLVERHHLTQSLGHKQLQSQVYSQGQLHRGGIPRPDACFHLPAVKGARSVADLAPSSKPECLSRVFSFYPKWPSHSSVPQTLYGFSIIRANEKFCIYLRIYWNWIIKRDVSK